VLSMYGRTIHRSVHVRLHITCGPGGERLALKPPARPEWPAADGRIPAL
jgi:hypothetical protein